ncbi:MAG: hypothetical protein KAJ54_01090 [Candidatus Aenigmarchaeota archaeon]|nr:hypothetical protein [Candidatus Aenigmarchaeota archaeon]MCK5321781.1 hypothetical protein [Candidatus Aenigmarchaeota archaeon]
MAQVEHKCGKRKCPLLGGDFVPVVYCDIAPCFSGTALGGCRYKNKCAQSLFGWSSQNV